MPVRRRDREFVGAYVMSVMDGQSEREAKLVAMRVAHPRMVRSRSERTVLEHAAAKLARTEAQAAIAEIFAEVGGFTPADAVREHVRHIRGYPRRVVDEQSGRVVEIQDPPSYAALRDYEKMIGLLQSTKRQEQAEDPDDFTRALLREPAGPEPTLGRFGDPPVEEPQAARSNARIDSDNIEEDDDAIDDEAMGSPDAELQRYANMMAAQLYRPDA
jgi:hypothetical protein